MQCTRAYTHNGWNHYPIAEWMQCKAIFSSSNSSQFAGWRSIDYFANDTISKQFSQDGRCCNVVDKDLPLCARRITSAFYSLPVYAGNEATSAQSRSSRDTVGTVPFRKSAHVQWKSTIGTNESVGNWHRAPGTKDAPCRVGPASVMHRLRRTLAVKLSQQLSCN